MAIGSWRDHFSYRAPIAVVQGGGTIYAATATGLFTLGIADHELGRFTKVQGLSDVNISALGWNPDLRALVIGYRNGNVDLLSGGSVMNISDIARSTMVGDKSIYALVAHGSDMLLGCGFGIVRLDLQRREVRDTYIIGPDASQQVVRGLVVHNDSIHAATESGLFSAWVHEPNLAAFLNWRKRTDAPRPNGPFTAIAAIGGRLLVSYNNPAQNGNDTIYYHDGSWHRFDAALGQRVLQLHATDDRLTVALGGMVRQYGVDLQELGAWYDVDGAWLDATAAIAREQGGAWITTRSMGLVQAPLNGPRTIHHPNGPSNNVNYRMNARQGRVIVGTGGPSGNWGNLFMKYGVHCYKEGVWSTIDMGNDPLMASGANTFGGTVNDIMGVAIDPADPDHAFAACWEEGLLEIRGDHVTAIWNTSNSSLQRNVNMDPSQNVVQVAAVTFDEDGNLWMTNAHTAAPISVRTKSGSWRAFEPGSVLGGNSLLGDIVVGDNGYKWITRPRGNGMLVFDDNGSIGEPGDDRYKVLNTVEGSGALPSVDVNALAVDHDGEVWVGTGRGVAVFHAPWSVFENSGGDAQQILIEQDGNYQYLLESESVSAIAVDGADRKWLGTQNAGVFLVSANGNEQVLHFTQANSPLPSNNIVSIAIDGASGEVFFGTDQGIISYRGTATEGELEASCAAVFPNPVHPTHTGPVAITGLVRDSDVRITDVAGNLVYRTTSQGGQAIWPATDLNGQRVSTGVYLVFVNDPDGLSSCNTKVLVVR